jgi:hypothetical protein
MVANAGEIFYPTSSDQHDGMLLQVVSNAGNIGSHFDSVGEPDARDLPQGRVRLLGRRCIDTCANPSLLRTTLQGGRRVFTSLFLSAFADQLTDRRHCFS